MLVIANCKCMQFLEFCIAKGGSFTSPSSFLRLSLQHKISNFSSILVALLNFAQECSGCESPRDVQSINTSETTCVFDMNETKKRDDE